MHSDTRTGGIEAVPIALYQDGQGGGLDFKFTSDIFYQIIAWLRRYVRMNNIWISKETY